MIIEKKHTMSYTFDFYCFWDCTVFRCTAGTCCSGFEQGIDKCGFPKTGAS